MGKIHLDEMVKAGMTPTAVAEIDTSRLKVAREHFPGIETYNSVAKMLKKSEYLHGSFLNHLLWHQREGGFSNGINKHRIKCNPPAVLLILAIRLLC